MMRKLALAATGAAVLAGAAFAAEEPQSYDRRLAQAAAEIVAARIGDLRGGFGTQEAPVLSMSPDKPAPDKLAVASPAAHAPALPPPGVWRNGLAIAVERKSGVSPEL